MSGRCASSEKPIAAPPLGFCGIEREVGVLQQVLCVVGVFRIHRDADRGADHHGFPAKLHRTVEQAAQLLADQARFRRVDDVLAQDHELVPAEPRNQRMGRHLEFELLRGDAQDLVADRVAVDVVDVLEAVEVDPDHRATPAGGTRFFDRFGQARTHQLAVRQRGEWIVVCEKRDARLRVLAFADVAEFEQARRALAMRDRACRDFDRDGVACAVGNVGVEA